MTDGITGDYEKLTAADVSSASAYKSASGTVVEITLNEQTDKGSGGAGTAVLHTAFTLSATFFPLWVS